MHTHKAMTNLRCVSRGESCFQNPKRAVATEKGHPQEAVPFSETPQLLSTPGPVGGEPGVNFQAFFSSQAVICS